MKFSKGKIILVVLVIYLGVFAVIKVNKKKDLNKDILEKVTYVSDAKVNPENEGKLVLVSGKIEYDNLVSFLELDENFGTIKISRKVEDCKREYDEEEKHFEYNWYERKSPLSDANGDFLKTIVSEEKVSKINIGEFVLDSKGLDLIPAKDHYAKEDNIGGLITTGIDYSRDPYGDTVEDGDMRITYLYYDLEKYPDLSILAVQKGNSFVPYEVDKKTSVYQVFAGKINDKDKLSSELDEKVKSSIRGEIFFIILVILIGSLLVYKPKNKNETLKKQA